LKAGQSLDDDGATEVVWSLWYSVAVRSCIDARFLQWPKREWGAPRAAKVSLRIAPRIHDPSPPSVRIAVGAWRLRIVATRWEKNSDREVPGYSARRPEYGALLDG
jgi:hypothetical protein